ncbi:hypothetical protein RJ640_010972 [Escallonia rubra]|uniref:RNA polymerase II C-terminal domain phosphatase-like n=1 Tax=Escallonia rubra TaxID=112253 RepID=A0AA88UT38_9ASTE|nr:hypothetical protein RJ640_010972 [Escallonia rubra]
MGTLCEQFMDDKNSGVANPSGTQSDLGHIDDTETRIARMRDQYMEKLFLLKKLILVLDLDHTLLHSIVRTEEENLESQTETDGLYSAESIVVLTKLRPGVRAFLKEASNMFELYIFTKACRPYALEMAKLLDPEGVYFDPSKVFSREHCDQEALKHLDWVPGRESGILILDDTERVWGRFKKNLVPIEKYWFFASQRDGDTGKSLAELNADESDTEGPLAAVLQDLKRIHSRFFDPRISDRLVDRDVKLVKKMVLDRETE